MDIIGYDTARYWRRKLAEHLASFALKGGHGVYVATSEGEMLTFLQANPTAVAIVNTLSLMLQIKRDHAGTVIVFSSIGNIEETVRQYGALYVDKTRFPGSLDHELSNLLRATS